MGTRFTDSALIRMLCARKTICSVSVALVLAFGSGRLPVHADAPLVKVEQAEKIDFARQRIELKQLGSLSLGELRILRGIVFGRHGRIFKEEQIQSYLRKR